MLDLNIWRCRNCITLHPAALYSLVLSLQWNFFMFVSAAAACSQQSLQYSGLMSVSKSSNSFQTTTATVFVQFTQNFAHVIYVPLCKQEVKVIDKKRLTGGSFPGQGSPQGSKFVPLNSWGRVSYQCSIVTINKPRMHRLATVHTRDNQRRHDTAYLNKRLFY